MILFKKKNQEVLIFIPNNSCNKQEPDQQAYQKAKAAGGRVVAQVDTLCCQRFY